MEAFLDVESESPSLFSLGIVKIRRQQMSY